MRNIFKLGIILLTLASVLVGCQQPSSDIDTKNSGDTANVDVGVNISEQLAPSIGDVEIVAEGFSGADGVVVDYLGNIFVGNRWSNILSKVTPQGEVVYFVTLPCIELLCMTIDEQNNIYAAGKDKVFKISQQGDVEVIGSDFTCADDVRLDLEGNVFVTDSFENRVYKITPDLKKSIFIDNDSEASLRRGTWYITGITFDNDYKNLYIAKMDEGEIVKYPILADGTAGIPEIIAEGLLEPDHLEIDEKGNIYVTLFREGSLIRIDPEGKVESICKNEFGYATGIAFGKKDFNEEYVFIADYQRNILYKVFVGESAASRK